MPISTPHYRPATDITGRATGGPVVGCRFVKCVGPKVNGGNIPVAHAGAADEPIGIAERDVAQDQVVRFFTDGFVTPAQANGSIAAGAAVQLAADGKVAPYTSGRKVGVALQSAAANNDLILIQIQL